MATEVVLPRLGLTQEDGTVVRWLKAEGSRVAKGEPLFEVMTDKATLEVEAPASGVLLRILVAEGHGDRPHDEVGVRDPHPFTAF